jgi:hypothetical protein
MGKVKHRLVRVEGVAVTNQTQEIKVCLFMSEISLSLDPVSSRDLLQLPLLFNQLSDRHVPLDASLPSLKHHRSAFPGDCARIELRSSRQIEIEPIHYAREVIHVKIDRDLLPSFSSQFQAPRNASPAGRLERGVSDGRIRDLLAEIDFVGLLLKTESGGEGRVSLGEGGGKVDRIILEQRPHRREMVRFDFADREFGRVVVGRNRREIFVWHRERPGELGFGEVVCAVRRIEGRRLLLLKRELGRLVRGVGLLGIRRGRIARGRGADEGGVDKGRLRLVAV